MNSTLLLTFVAYLASLIAIGFWSSKRASRDITDYFIGGRTMNKYVVALSAVVSGRSAWLLLGLTGLAYHVGVAAIWSVVGYIAVECAMFIWLAPHIRKRSEETDSITIPDLLAGLYPNQARSLRILSVLVLLIFITGYVAAQFVAGGKAFVSVFEWSSAQGMLVTAGIILLYTLLGGYVAVSVTDVIQGFFMILCLLLLPLVILSEMGGFGALFTQLRQESSGLLAFTSIGFGSMTSALAIGLGSIGSPHIMVRFMSIDQAEHLKIGAIVATSWNVLMALGAIFIGLTGRIVVHDSAMLPNADAEGLYPFLASVYLHPVLFGLVVASIFAAIMSTADSLLLIIASSLVRDVYQQMSKKVLSDSRLVYLSRTSVVLFVGVALWVGFTGTDVIYVLVLSSWAGLGASFGPAVLFAIFYPRTTGKGIVAGILTGALCTLVWVSTPYLKALTYELIPAFFLSSLATWLVSRWTN